MKAYQTIFSALLCWIAVQPELIARPWTFTGNPTPVEAEYLGMTDGKVMLKSPDGRERGFPLTRFSPADQDFVRSQAGSQLPSPGTPAKPETVANLVNRTLTLDGAKELHVTDSGDPLAGSSINFTSADAWLFLDHIAPKTVESGLLKRMRVNGGNAIADKNVRIVQYGPGTVIIPHEPGYAAMTVFAGPSFEGASKPLTCYEEYTDAKLMPMKEAISSFRLKRGYMATIGTQRDGTGSSKNYVAQDHDIEVSTLPAGMDKNIRFIRVFPWRWASKKGMSGNIWQKFNVSWYYDWNISSESSADLEYVPIAQKIGWPDLKQNWKDRGSIHLLGYNEPDHDDQSNLTPDQAIKGWPSLLASGLRLGSPAVSDGGLGWLDEFMKKADAAKYRVDFIAVHYYRSYSNPGNAKGAAEQFYQFLKGIHDKTNRPIWITEWNNGANWTKDPKPTAEQQKDTIAAMVKMLDETPFVERYAIYNWVEDCRYIYFDKEDKITPAGEVYRDQVSPVSYKQESTGKKR